VLTSVIILCFESTLLSAAEYDFFKGQKTKIKDPFKLRDPFKIPLARSDKKIITSVSNKIGENSYSNIPSVTGIPIDKLTVVGIMLGKNRRAILKATGKKDTYIVKEGMTLGKDNSIIRAIMPGGIVLVEKIKNVYDQFEYLETLLPLVAE